MYFFINTAAVRWPATRQVVTDAAKLEKDKAKNMNRVITKEDDERTFIQLEDEELKEGEADSILQYLADCLRATQTRAKHTKEIGLAKDNDGIYLDLTTADRYRDYATYAQGITAANPEHFMAQDLAKWTNQDFAVSIYNMVNDAPDDPKAKE